MSSPTSFDLIPKNFENYSLASIAFTPQQSRNYNELIAPYQNNLALLPKVSELAQALVLMMPNPIVQKRYMSMHMSYQLTLVEGHKKLDERDENSRELAIRNDEIKKETASRSIEIKQDCEKNKAAALKSEFAIVSNQLATCDIIESESNQYKNAKVNTEDKIKSLLKENEALLKERDNQVEINKRLRGL